MNTQNTSITGLIWIKEQGGWLHLENGSPVGFYNHPYDFANKIKLACDGINTDRWNQVIQTLKEKYSHLI